MPEVQIVHPAPDGDGTSVVVDGVEMKHSLTGVDVEFIGGRPRVTLDIIAVQDLRLCSKDAEVVIGRDAEALLIAAGWTRPGMDR
jgi:hypothetical protein